MNKMMKVIFYVLPWVVWLTAAAASDLPKERRWADQIVDSVMVGDVVWLRTGDHRFLGLYTPATTFRTRGGVILMHGTGVHPNWRDVIFPLRTELPERGWATRRAASEPSSPSASPRRPPCRRWTPSSC